MGICRNRGLPDEKVRAEARSGRAGMQGSSRGSDYVSAHTSQLPVRLE
ncbi:MAG: hypothetical protein ACI835_005532 [Planctomycetota bacterium]|jgi:hypothetical protein